jgi:FkbM family methyltransferase
MIERVRLLIRYILNLGFVEGIRLFYAAELRGGDVRVIGWKNRITLRPLSTDLLVFREIFLFKAYDVPMENVTTIIDGGANTGLSTIFFKRTFPDASIFAIEPDASNFEMLKKNVESVDRIVLLNAALWNKSAWIRVKEGGEGSSWTMEVEECSPSAPGALKSVTISEIMQQYGLAKIDLLKLDVESAEKEIFSTDFETWLPLTRYLVVELHDWLKPGCSTALFGAVSRFNFNTRIVNGMLVLENRDLR